MSSKSLIDHSLSVPDGPIGPKYVDFVLNEWFKEMAFMGPFNVAKSTALVDYLLVSGMMYPGANLLLSRAKRSDLYRTTLNKYLTRAGLLLDESNKNDGVYYFPEVNGERSRLYVLGLDRVDLREVLKSFEPFRVAFEESDEIRQEAFNLVLGRCRQKVRHINRTNAWYAGHLAARWGVEYDRAVELLGFDQDDLKLGHYGPNQLKYVFNPTGNDPTWKRVMNVPYPDPTVVNVREWLESNVGISEFHIPYAQLGSYKLKTGNLVALGDGKRSYVGRSEDEDGKIELVDGRKVAAKSLAFIGQRASIFAWPDENWSRNVESDENFLYMNDDDMRRMYFEGIADTRRGLVFPEFDRSTHIVPAPKRDIPGGTRVQVAVDQGYRHPTVALVAVETHYPAGGLLIVKEYMVAGRSAFDNAYQIRQLVPPHLTDVVYWADPSMWRTEATSMRSVADEYAEAGIPLYKADNNMDYTIDAGKKLLRLEEDYRTGDRLPRIFVSEDCKQLIYALETATMDHLASKRDNWMVDMIDTFRYLVSGTYNRVVASSFQFRKRAPTRTFDW